MICDIVWQETNTALESNYNPIKNKFKNGSDIQPLLLQDLIAVGRMNSGNARVKVLKVRG